jgi:indole-3-glycerol phosphate synthase
MHSEKVPPILQKIIEKKKEEVEKISKNLHYSTSDKSFKNSLTDPFKTGIIAECKKSSPSAGIIRQGYDPVSIAKVYESCGASAVSVLTDRSFFSGSPEDLRLVSSTIKIPTLRKDFIIDERQIFETRTLGAAAVLLIARILSFSQLKEFIQISESLNMDCLVETHNAGEIELALNAGAKILGINTRDLDTFEIHTDLISSLSKLIPKTCISVGESGIKNRSDYLDMKQHVDSVLIGTYFMKSENIQESFKSLLG